MTPRDLRRYARQTNIRLVAGALLVFFVVGIGLIFYIYGREPALMGLLCMLIGLAPVLLIVLILWIMDWVVNRDDRR